MSDLDRRLQPVPAATPTVWTARTLNDVTWSHKLTGRQRRALVEYARGGSEDELRRTFAGPADRWREDLNSRHGFVRIREFPVDELDDGGLRRSFLGLSCLLGELVAQDRAGNTLADIRDTGGDPQTGRRYETTLDQDFHTDASDLVGLLCLRSAKAGGESRIVSAHTVYNEMLRRAPHLLRRLYAKLPWSRHSSGAGVAPYFELAPFSDVDGLPRLFVIPWYIRQSQMHSEAPRLDGDQLAALDLMADVAQDPANWLQMVFAPGDVQYLNNTTILHSRTAYTDYKDPAQKRHLLRVWLSNGTTPAENSVSLPSRLGNSSGRKTI